MHRTQCLIVGFQIPRAKIFENEIHDGTEKLNDRIFGLTNFRPSVAKNFRHQLSC